MGCYFSIKRMLQLLSGGIGFHSDSSLRKGDVVLNEGSLLGRQAAICTLRQATSISLF